jgi:hypothetical protein
MRFRRRIRLAPGIALNLSGSGLSASVGPQGASLTFGRQGVHQNLSIPGTGLYHRSKVSGGAAPKRKRVPTEAPSVSGVRIDFDGGPVVVLDDDDQAIPQELVDRHWNQWKAAIVPAIEAALAERNAATNALAFLHQQTPAPTPSLAYVSTPSPPPPEAPEPRGYHWLWRVLPWHRSTVDEANASAAAAHTAALGRWQIEREMLQAGERARRAAFEARNADAPGVEAFLVSHLGRLAWPLETSASVAAVDEGRCVGVDVDLPEIEMLPGGLLEVGARGREIRIKPFSDTARRRLYQGVVYGTVFRLVGEIFHAVPRVQRVIASGYSQRADPTSGQVRDEYLLSVEVHRADWERLAFDRLELVEPAEALKALGARVRVVRSQFVAVTPLELPDAS